MMGGAEDARGKGDLSEGETADLLTSGQVLIGGLGVSA